MKKILELRLLLCIGVGAMVVGQLNAASEADLFATTCEGDAICIDTTYEAVGSVTLSIPSGPTNGMASSTPCDPGNANIGIMYTPNPGFIGVDYFTYEIDDDDTGMGADQTGLVTVNVIECPTREVCSLQPQVRLAICSCPCCACLCEDLTYCIRLIVDGKCMFEANEPFEVTISGLWEVPNGPSCFKADSVVACDQSSGTTDKDAAAGTITWSDIDLSSGEASLCIQTIPLITKCISVQAQVTGFPSEPSAVKVVSGGCDFADCGCDTEACPICPVEID